MWKIVIGLVLLAVLVTAVVVLVVTSVSKGDEENTNQPQEDTIGNMHSENINTIDGDGGEYIDNSGYGEDGYGEDGYGEDGDTEITNVGGTVESFKIRNQYGGNITNTGMTIPVGTTEPLTIEVTPEGAEATLSWTSTTDSVYAVVENANDETGMTVNVTGLAKGSGTITFTVGDISVDFEVYVNNG